MIYTFLSRLECVFMKKRYEEKTVNYEEKWLFLIKRIIIYEKLVIIVYRNNRVICEEEILCQNHLD